MRIRIRNPGVDSEALSANVCNPGTGEHIDNLELFEEKTFVSKLLGMGDIQASCYLLISMTVNSIF
jgi:signal recognition particle GTPase